jgi:hypothetical protein
MESVVAYQTVRCSVCGTVLPVTWVEGQCIAYHNAPILCSNNGTNWIVPSVELEQYNREAPVTAEEG